MESTVGPERNLLLPEPESCRQIGVTLSDHRQRSAGQAAPHPGHRSPGFRSVTLPMLYARRKAAPAWSGRWTSCSAQASEAVNAGNTILILSDRGVTESSRPFPSLLATAGVHHHLVREGTRTRCALVLESGDAREVHHVALLIGYGAGAVNPYLAFETLDDMIRQGVLEGITHERARLNYIKALNKGILKVMSKMGISTLQSYCGAQIFEAIGLEQAFVDRYFTWTASRIGGVGIDVIARGSARSATSGRSRRAAGAPTSSTRAANTSGAATANCTCSTRRRSTSCSTRRAAASTRIYRDYTKLVNDQSRAARHAARAARLQGRPRADPARRSRAGRSHPQALRHRRDVVRLDQPGSARDDRDRDEPAGRQVEHRRRRRGSRALPAATPTATRAAAPSSRSRRHGSASRASTWSTPTTCRSRWRRAPSRAKAASCPATRSIRGSPRSAIRRPASTLISPPPHHDIYSIEDLAQLISRSEERESRRARSRQARGRSRRRHGRRRRVEGARRRRADLRP